MCLVRASQRLSFVCLALFALHGTCRADDLSGRALNDIKLYFTAPARWDQSDWLYLGGTIAATAIAYHYDDDVRAHFLKSNPSLATTTDSHDGEDAAPALIALLGTGLFAAITRD